MSESESQFNAYDSELSSCGSIERQIIITFSVCWFGHVCLLSNYMRIICLKLLFVWMPFPGSSFVTDLTTWLVPEMHHYIFCIFH